jgi:hypothetical protein
MPMAPRLCEQQHTVAGVLATYAHILKNRRSQERSRERGPIVVARKPGPDTTPQVLLGQAASLVVAKKPG